MRMSALVASVASVGIATVAFADTASNNTPGSWTHGLPDNGIGSYSSMIVLPALASINSITVTLAHSWSSDLTITVTGSNGSTFQLWDGPNIDGGGLNFGTVGTGGTGGGPEPAPLPYTWAASGTPNPFGSNASPPIPNGPTYQANAWTSGALLAGTYTINITDNVGGDGATISGWSINYSPVPGPGAMALMGLAGLVGARRRRV